MPKPTAAGVPVVMMPPGFGVMNSGICSITVGRSKVTSEGRPVLHLVPVHLAAAVSGECEQIFDLGWTVNATDFQSMLEKIRALSEADGYCPGLVFALSVAAYGGPLPDGVPDDFHLTPHSSYGAQKVVGEIMLADYARKGFMDGVSLRLPTIGRRPGKPNAAASPCFWF